MSTYDLYIYDQTLTLTLNSGVNSNMPMYDKNIILYNGVDNKLKFVFRDNDRAIFDITNQNVYFNMIGTNNNETVINKLMTVTNALKGEAELEVTAQDVYNISEGFYNYSVYIESTSTKEQKIAFTDRAGDFIGTAEVRSGGLPSARPTQTVDSFTQAGSYYYSQAMKGSSERNLTARNHTIAVYTTGYTGDFEVQGNLDVTPSSDNNDWFTVNILGHGGVPISFTTETGVNAFFFETSAPHLRIRHTISAGTVDKVLLRN